MTAADCSPLNPNAILRLAASQSPEIHRHYATRSTYLDVHSAEPPWYHVDRRAGEDRAGQFRQVWDVHRQLWSYARETHEGPVFGEGNHHWYWSGCLDGVEAQFGSGWPARRGFDAPLAVDFDLLKMHPLQVNHGVGYYNRWWPTEFYQTNWVSGPVPMTVLDRYRVQEVAYGHAGFLDGLVYSIVPLAWLEHHLLSPVMGRYTISRPVAILYDADGAWLDASAAAKLERGDANHRVRIHYENGLIVTANGSSNTWTADSWTLPAWGWVAGGAGITAGTTLRDGIVTDFANTGDTLFVNARAAIDWNLSTARQIRPGVAAFEQTGNRAFRVTYGWDVQDSLARDYTAFVHFSTDEIIHAQQDHPVSPPTTQWQPGQVVTDGPWNVTLPENLPDRDYDWLTGLYDPTDGSRVALQGVDDGTSRIRLGVLRLANAGTTLAFLVETNAPILDPTVWYEQRLNSSNLTVDFGPVRTDGSISLRREGNLWRLKTWPRHRDFTLEFSRDRFPEPIQIQGLGGAESQITPMPLGSHWRLPLNGSIEYQWIQLPPELSVVWSNDTVRIAWPASVAGYTLETTSDLVPPANWNRVTNSVLHADGTLSVVLLPLGSQQFLRLKLL